MTDKQRIIVEYYADEAVWNTVDAHAIRTCLDEYDAAIALACRVHAECGPAEEYIADRHGWTCEQCHSSAISRDKIYHKPDCLWLAADALRERMVRHERANAGTLVLPREC